MITYTTQLSQEARGRHGWFLAREASIWTVPTGNPVRLEVFSKQKGLYPPIVVTLQRSEALEIAALLVCAALET